MSNRTNRGKFETHNHAPIPTETNPNISICRHKDTCIFCVLRLCQTTMKAAADLREVSDTSSPLTKGNTRCGGFIVAESPYTQGPVWVENRNNIVHFSSLPYATSSVTIFQTPFCLEPQASWRPAQIDGPSRTSQSSTVMKDCRSASKKPMSDPGLRVSSQSPCG